MSDGTPTPVPPPNVAMFFACGVALATLAPVALHQMGALHRLPDPPGKLFDSDGVTGSKTAHPFGLPDGLLGIASYGATLALMVAARENTTARQLLAAKLVADGGVAAFNTARQVVRFRRICSWCTGTAFATAAMLFAGRGLLRAAAGCASDEWRVISS